MNLQNSQRGIHSNVCLTHVNVRALMSRKPKTGRSTIAEDLCDRSKRDCANSKKKWRTVEKMVDDRKNASDARVRVVSDGSVDRATIVTILINLIIVSAQITRVIGSGRRDRIERFRSGHIFFNCFERL